MSDNRDLSRFRIWLLAIRPKTLPAGIVPVVIGAVLAYETGIFHTAAFLFALAGSILIQIGANFANDLFDYLKKSDDSERVGPLRVTQAGLVSPAQMKVAIFVVFFLAFLVGIYLVYRGGMPIVIIGLASILFGILYTGGPYPLGYFGLGDILVLIFYGPVAVCGTYYVITLDFNSTVLLAGIPPGMLATAILTVNNLRDIDNDRRTGKRTLAVRFGRSFARFEYVLMLSGAALFPILIYLVDGAHKWSMVSATILIPGAAAARSILTQTSGPVLNRVLAETSRLTALYGLFFSAGWLL
jgi:1,4-dihydroxy-2-naphthoate octaprenyltransferase